MDLTAEEWDQFAKIKNRVCDAQFQLREHWAECESDFPKMRRGVIVKFVVGHLAFKREFALTGVEAV